MKCSKYPSCSPWALPAIFLLLLVGFISASWIGSGTIPYMILSRIGINASNHLFVFRFLTLCDRFYCNGFKLGDCLVTWYCTDRHCSGLGVPLPIAAGAIVSGCFLGDKWSPLSDTPNLTAATNRRDIVQIFTSMIPTSGIGAIIAAAAFLILGFFLPHSANTDTSGIEILKSGLQDSFSFNIFLLLPVILVFILAARKSRLCLFLLAVLLSLLSKLSFSENVPG